MTRRRSFSEGERGIPPPHYFAAAIRDETWILDEAPRLIESRWEAGIARTSAAGRAFDIEATDDFAALELPDGRAVAEALTDRASSGVSRSRGLIESCRGRGAVARLVARSRWIRTGDDVVEDDSLVATVSVRYAGEDGAIVAAPADLPRAWKWLCSTLVDVPRDAYEWRRFPLVWKNGTGAVLLHEAVGHPAERHASAVRWPRWLHVVDAPDGGTDDCGRAIEARDLLRDAPFAFRRATFRDVPTIRMTALSVSAEPTDWQEMPETIEISLVDHGGFDPLTDIVTLRVVVADHVAGGRRTRVQPFTFRARRGVIASALSAARGDAVAFPGVICSDEGQRLPVASASPDLLMMPLEAR